MSEPLDLEAIGFASSTDEVLALVAEVRRLRAVNEENWNRAFRAELERDRLRADLAACRAALTEVRGQFFEEPEVGWRKRMLDRLDAALLGEGG